MSLCIPDPKHEWTGKKEDIGRSGLGDKKHAKKDRGAMATRMPYKKCKGMMYEREKGPDC